MKIFLDTIGCRLNQAEIETVARQFRAAGHEIVASAGEADLAVVNTCTVTSEAASDSRAAIRRANRSGLNAIVATGCWATMEPVAAAGMPGVSCIVPNQDKDKLVPSLLEIPLEYFDLEPIARVPLPGMHARTRAFIKVQDGCNNACSYCITTLARGSSRSRTSRQVITDVKGALDGGAKEIVLTGVHLGAWGLDFSPRQRLPDLLDFLLAHADIPRLRLSSLEPWDVEPGFFDLWKNTSLCRHLHLPLQSGSFSVLQRMNRKIAPDAYEHLLCDVRTSIPSVAVTTDIIVGFPGETDEEFMESLAFIRKMDFAGGHVFTYSARPGTAAASLPGRIHGQVARQRSQVMRQLLSDSAQSFRQKFIGSAFPVLWESTSQLSDHGWRLEGLTDNYLRVSARSNRPHRNRIEMVGIQSLEDDILTGEIIPDK